jgi:hypothetical protein
LVFYAIISVYVDCDILLVEKQFMNRLNVLAGNANVLNQMLPVSTLAVIIMDQREGQRL